MTKLAHILVFLSIAHINFKQSACDGSQQIVPIIDISGLFNGSQVEKKAIANKLGNACTDVGFFIITGHNIPETTLQNACTFIICFINSITSFH